MVVLLHQMKLELVLQDLKEVVVTIIYNTLRINKNIFCKEGGGGEGGGGGHEAQKGGEHKAASHGALNLFN